MDDKTKKAPSFTMVLQCNIAENYARYPDAVFSGPAKNRHDSCAIVGVVLIGGVKRFSIVIALTI